MSKLQSIADFERYAAACVRYANETSDYNFRIEFDDTEDPRSPKYYTYRKGKDVIIHVPHPNIATSERDIKIIKAGMLHEILHPAEGTHDAKQEIVDSGIGKLDNNDPLAMIFNQVEDHRIERRDCEKFAGDANVLRDAYEILSQEMNEELKKQDLSGMSDTAKKMMGLRLADLIGREPWMNLVETTSEFNELCPDDARETASKLVDAGIDEELRQVDTVTDTINTSKRIFNLLFEDTDAEEHIEQNAQESQEGDGDQQGEQSEGQGEGQPSEGEQAQAQKAEQGSGEGNEVRLEEAEADFLEYLQNKQKIPDAGTDPPSAGMHIDYNKYLENPTPPMHTFQQCPMDEIGVANFGANYYKNTPQSDVRALTRHPRTGMRGLGSIEEVFKSHGIQVSALGNKVRRLLQVQSQARWTGGAQSGRMHRKRAWRAAMPTVGDGRWNREIFKQRHQDETLDVAVSVLCDFSGSMGGAKMAHATFGGFILSDAISRVLRVPVQVQTFSEVDEYTIICVLKNWNENVSEEEFKQRAARAVNTMEQNDDAAAILWTYESLRQRPEKRKVMIVLSDGSPASSRGGDEMRCTQQVVKDIEEEGFIETYGIGIMDHNVRHIYKDHEQISEPDHIEPAILNTVKRKLIV